MPDVVIWYDPDLEPGAWYAVEYDAGRMRLAQQRLDDFLAAWLRQRSRAAREGED